MIEATPIVLWFTEELYLQSVKSVKGQWQKCWIDMVGTFKVSRRDTSCHRFDQSIAIVLVKQLS